MSAESIVSGIQSQINGYVQAATSAAQSAASVINSGYQYTQVTPGGVKLDATETQEAIRMLKAEADRIRALSTDLLNKLPSLDEAGAAPAAPSVTVPTAPTLSGSPTTAPTSPTLVDLTVPAAPTLTMPDAPDLVLPNLPSAPTLTMPTAPTLDTNIVLPDAPVITLPTFDASYVPPFVLNPVAVDLSRLQPEADEAWTSTAYTLLMNAITDGLAKGPLPGTEEQELYDRARRRLADEYNDRRTETTQRFAALNYPAPPGAQLAALQRLNEKEAIELQNMNAQIMDTQLTKRIEHQRFLMELLQRVDAQCMQWLAGVRERIVSVLRAQAEIQLQQMQANIALLKQSLEQYQTEAQVFSERIRAAGFALEVYRGQLEGAKMRGELNQQQVELYTALVGAQETAVRAYTAQVDAVNSSVKAQLAKVEIFRAKVDGVRAAGEVYDTQVRAVDAQARVQSAKVGIYGQQVDAWRTTEEVRLRQFDAALQQHDAATKVEMAKLDVFKGQLAAFTARLEALNAKFSAYGAQAGVVTSTGNTIVNAIGRMGDASTQLASLAVQQSNALNQALVNSQEAAAKSNAHRLEALVAAVKEEGGAAERGIAALGQMGAGITLKVE